jgi:hypothetical protein
MSKCGKVGCLKEATIVEKIPLVDGINTVIFACSKEHFDEIVKALTAFREDECEYNQCRIKT